MPISQRNLTIRSHADEPFSHLFSSHIGATPDAYCRRPGLDAGRLRCHALRPGSGTHHARPGDEQGHSRTTEQPDSSGFGDWRRCVWIHRRSTGAQARSDVEHSHLLGLFVRIRALNLGSHVGGIPFHPGAGHGRRVEYGGNLVAETWPTELRAKAISVVQSSWAIGYALAALVTGVVLHYADWRMAFFVGILPALVVLWIRRGVPESEMWQDRHRAEGRGTVGRKEKEDAASYVSTTDSQDCGFASIFRTPYGKHTFALLLMNFFGMFAWWGLFTWIPPYLSLPVEQGGRGFGVMGTTTLLVVLNLTGNVSRICEFRLGRGCDWTAQVFYFIHVNGGTSSPALRHGESTVAADGCRIASRIFRHRIFFGVGNYRERDLPYHGSSSRPGLYLQRRANHELDCSVCNRQSGPNTGVELGVLLVWRGVSSGVRSSHAIARDQRETTGVAVCQSSVCQSSAQHSQSSLRLRLSPTLLALRRYRSRSADEPSGRGRWQPELRRA